MSLRTLTLLIVLLASCGILGFAQDGRPSDGADSPVDVSREPARPNLLRELGLSREQLRQIRQINVQRKPLMERAHLTLRAAVKALDDAIYSDTVNDADVSARISDLQSAQAEIARLRFESELSVRKVLTPEQLVRFRQMRQSFADERDKFRTKRRRGRMPLRQYKKRDEAFPDVH